MSTAYITVCAYTVTPRDRDYSGSTVRGKSRKVRGNRWFSPSNGGTVSAMSTDTSAYRNRLPLLGPSPRLLTVREVAEQLGLSLDEIRTRCRTGEIPAYRTRKQGTGHYRIAENDLKAYIAALAVPSVEAAS